MPHPYPWSGDINVDPASVPSPVYATLDASGNVVGLGVVGESIYVSATVDGELTKISEGSYQATSNTTINGTVDLRGATITIDSGVTLTLEHPPLTERGVAVFYGAGTVKILSGYYDVSWFDGASIDAKWDFTRRGFTTNRRKNIVFPRPSPSDPAAVDVGAYGGWVWRAGAPLIFGDPENQSIVNFECGIAANTAIASIIQLGDSANNLKTEGLLFPSGIELYGNDVALRGVHMVGVAHLYAPRIAVWGCDAPLVAISGEDTNLGVNDITIGRFYAARYSAVPLQIIGKNDIRLSDFRIDHASFDGALTASVANLVNVQGVCRSISLSIDNNPTLTAGLYDTTAELVAVNSHATSLNSVENLVLSISNQAASGTKKYLTVARSNASASVNRHLRVISTYSRSAPTSSDAFTLDQCDDVTIAGSRTDKITMSNSTNVNLIGFERSNVTSTSAMPSVNGAMQRVFTLADNVTSGTTIPIFLRGSALVTVTVSSGSSVDACMVATKTDGSNGITIIANASGLFTTTADTASKINLTVTNGTISVQNKTGVSKTVVIELNY